MTPLVRPSKWAFKKKKKDKIVRQYVLMYFYFLILLTCRIFFAYVLLTCRIFCLCIAFFFAYVSLFFCLHIAFFCLRVAFICLRVAFICLRVAFVARFDRTLGGYEMQLRLRDFLATKFNEMKKTSTDVFKNPRAMNKLNKEAGRLKHVLSANTEFVSQVRLLIWKAIVKGKFS